MAEYKGGGKVELPLSFLTSGVGRKTQLKMYNLYQGNDNSWHANLISHIKEFN